MAEPVGEDGVGSGTARRVPGLRRDEVAILAGMSVDCYTRMEPIRSAEYPTTADASPREQLAARGALQ